MGKRSITFTIFSCSLIVGCQPKVKEKIVIERVEVPVEVEKIVEVFKDPVTGEITPVDVANGETEVVAIDSDIKFSGSLAISVVDTGPSARFTRATAQASDYALNCVTSTDTPTAFQVPVVAAANGDLSFSGTLENFGGVSFGCFIMNKGQFKAPIVFDADSNLVAGGGDLVSNIEFNPSTKTANAAIDMDKSTALTPANIDAAMKSKGVSATTLANISGTYKLTCDENFSGMSCSGAQSVPDKLFFAQFSQGTDKMVAAWKDKASHDKCVPSGTASTDANPAFGLRFGTGGSELMMAMNFTNESTLNGSIDSAFAALKGSADADFRDFAAALENNAKSRESWKTEFCALNPFIDTNCKLIIGEYESYTYLDWATQKEVTYTYPKYFDDIAFANATDFSGTAKQNDVPCAVHWTNNKDICPAGTTVDENGIGSYKAYFTAVAGVAGAATEDKRLRLLCKDPTQSWVRYQENAKAGTRSAAVTAASASYGCNKISGGLMNNWYEIERNAMRNVFTETAANIANRGTDLCKHYAVPTDFTFKSCASMNTDQLMYMYWEPEKPTWITSEMDTVAQNLGMSYQYYDAADRSTLELCRMVKNNLSSWMMKVNDTSGQIEADGVGVPSITDSYFGQFGCPTAYGVYTANIGTPMDGAACATEFTALSVSAQVEKLLKYRTGTWDPVRYSACTSMDTAVRAKFTTGLANTCMPSSRISYMCDNSGNCLSSLRCDGTKGGKCVDDNGTFIGRINNRISAMNLREKTGGAFEMSSTASDKWMAWDVQTSKMKMCSLTNEVIITARMDALGADFNSFYKEKIKQVCEEPAAGSEGEGGNNTTGTVAGGGAGGENKGAESLPEVDLLMKLRFKKCANETCT